MNKKIKKILGSLLIVVSFISMILMLVDYFYIPFKFSKTAAICILAITLIGYFIVDWENIK